MPSGSPSSAGSWRLRARRDRRVPGRVGRCGGPGAGAGDHLRLLGRRLRGHAAAGPRADHGLGRGVGDRVRRGHRRALGDDAATGRHRSGWVAARGDARARGGRPDPRHGGHDRRAARAAAGSSLQRRGRRGDVRRRFGGRVRRRPGHRGLDRTSSPTARRRSGSRCRGSPGSSRSRSRSRWWQPVPSARRSGPFWLRYRAPVRDRAALGTRRPSGRRVPPGGGLAGRDRAGRLSARADRQRRRPARRSRRWRCCGCGACCISAFSRRPSRSRWATRSCAPTAATDPAPHVLRELRHLAPRPAQTP